MRNPASSDDDWDDLARELGVDKSAPPPLPESHAPDMVERQVEAEIVEPHHGMDERVEEEAVAEGEPEAAADEEFAEGEEGAPAEGDLNAEGPPGTGRKRRRRRRRRRKGGAAEGAEVVAAEAGEAESTEGAEEEAEVLAAVPAGKAGEEEGFPFEDEGEFSPLAAEEDTASDVLRDLIATWNVPSWDDIVGGLYRPER